MGNHRTSLIFAAVLGVGMLGTIGACGVSPTPTPTASVSSSPASSPTPTPTPTAEAAPSPTCENIVSASRQSAMSAGGASLLPSAEFLAKVAAEGRPGPYALFAANGGVVCAWSQGQEVFDVYGYTPLAAGQAAEMGSLIADSDPYAVSDYAGGTLYSTQMDGNPFAYFLVTAEATYLASTMDALDEVIATAP